MFGFGYLLLFLLIVFKDKGDYTHTIIQKLMKFFLKMLMYKLNKFRW